MDWFDNLLEETKDATAGEWKIFFCLDGTSDVDAHCSTPGKPETAYVDFHGSSYPVNNANAKLLANAVKMRDEIIRLRKLLGASEMINTHSSLDEK